MAPPSRPRLPKDARIGPGLSVARALYVTEDIELHETSGNERERSLVLIYSRDATADGSRLACWLAARVEGLSGVPLVEPVEELTDVGGRVEALLPGWAGYRFRLRAGWRWWDGTAIGLSGSLVVALARETSLAITRRMRLVWEPRLTVVDEASESIPIPLVARAGQDVAGHDAVSDLVGALYRLLAGMDSPLGEANLPPLHEWVLGLSPKTSARVAELVRRIRDRELPSDANEAIDWATKALCAAADPKDSPPVAAPPTASESSSATPTDVTAERGLAAVAGMHGLKDLLRHEVIGPARDPENHKRYGLGLPRGILLFGPPGCGKTYIARRLAEELGFHFVEVLPSSVGSPYVHETSLRMRRKFDEARRRAPALLFFDEFDAIAPRREELGGAQQHKSEEVNELLAHLNDCADAGVLVVAATNEPEKVDPAVRRSGRLDKVLYVGPPDREARIEILRYHLGRRPGADQIDVGRVADELDGYSASDLRLLVDEAARDALRASTDLTRAGLFEAAGRVPGSVTREVQERYRAFATRGIA